MNKSIVLKWFTIIISILCIIHFSISLVWWYLFVRHYLTESNRVQLIWAAFAILFLIASIIAFQITLKRKREGVIIVLSIIFVATGVYFYETSNRLYQFKIPILHIGTKYFNFSIGYEEFYCNWWWYHRVNKYLDQTEYKSHEPVKKGSE